jgi:hypothetical protein
MSAAAALAADLDDPAVEDAVADSHGPMDRTSAAAMVRTAASTAGDLRT